ncbi:MAG TPA: amidohydrolase family protein, partial [Sphingopyxis sp.]|nr:amidohydrolase family protein [Sphingopyxis sp.]
MRHLQRCHLTAALAAALLAAPASAETLYIEAGRLIDGVSDEVRTGQCITVADERITAVAPCGPTPDGATRLDWSGFTVLPGLIDLHTHLADVGQSADLAAPIKASPAETALVGARNARVTLEAGFTSVRDVGTYRGLTDVALKGAIERGDVPGPRMWVAGAYITIPKGGGELNGVVPNEELPADMRLGVAATPEEAAEKAAFLLDNVLCWEAAAGTGQQISL